MKDLNAGPDTIKLQEKNIGRILFDISCSNVFLNPSPKAKGTKAKISKWDLIKLKSFCTAKETSIKQKDNLMNGRRYLQMIRLISGQG